MSHILNDRYEENQDVSLLAEDQYKGAVSWQEQLSEQEQQKLLRRVHRGYVERSQACPNQWILNLARHARDELVEAYQPLVLSLASRLFARFSRDMELLDLVSEGNIALIRLLDEYEIREDGSFVGLVKVRVHGAMVDALRDRGRMVRLPGYVWLEVRKLAAVQKVLFARFDRVPIPQEVADEMHVPVAKVYEWLAYRAGASVLSLQGLVQEGEDDDFTTFLAAPDPVGEHASLCRASVKEAVHEALKNLPARQREVLQLRYGFEGEREYQDIGIALGMTRSGAFMCEKRAKKKLTQRLSHLYQEVSA